MAQGEQRLAILLTDVMAREPGLVEIRYDRR